jgi:thioredoxin reductase (NADPH)
VTLVHRRDALRASPGLQRRAFGEKRIDFCWNSVVREIRGQERVRGIVVGDPGGAGGTREIPCEGVFIFVGSEPNTGFLKGAVELDEAGCVVVDKTMAASLPGVFAAGDVRSGSVRQIASAVGDGVTAVLRAEVFLGVHG